MLYRRALIVELTATFTATFAVLMAIAVTTLWIRFLGRAATGVVPPQGVMVLLGFSTLGYLPVLLSVALFLGTLLTFTRMARDSELVVWQSVGLGATAWIGPVLRVALPVVFVIALGSLVLSPWAQQKATEYRHRLEAREDLATITPGVFKENRAQDRVYFVEGLSPSGDAVRNVFVRAEQHGRMGIVVARAGRQWEAPNQDHFLVMEDGRRYEGVPGQLDYRIMQFQRYFLRIEPFEARIVEYATLAQSTWMLLLRRTPEAVAELQWRLALPVGGLMLALLAIPLGYVSPRSARSFHLSAALLIFMIYNNLLSLAQAWVAQERLTPWIGLWGVHLAMLLAIAYLFHRRLSVVPLLSWKKR